MVAAQKKFAGSVGGGSSSTFAAGLIPTHADPDPPILAAGRTIGEARRFASGMVMATGREYMIFQHQGESWYIEVERGPEPTTC